MRTAVNFGYQLVSPSVQPFNLLAVPNDKSNGIYECSSLCPEINMTGELSDFPKTINFPCYGGGTLTPLKGYRRANCGVTLFSLPIIPCRETFGDEVVGGSRIPTWKKTGKEKGIGKQNKP